MFGNLDERLFQGRRAGQHVDETGTRCQPEEFVHAGATQIGVHHEHALLELLRHGEGQIQRRHGLAVTLARARDLNHPEGLAALRAPDPATQRTVLLGRGREGIERRDQHRTQGCLDESHLTESFRARRRRVEGRSLDLNDTEISALVDARLVNRLGRSVWANARLEHWRRVADRRCL